MSDWPPRTRCCGGVYCQKREDCRQWPCEHYESQLKLFEHTCECGHSRYSHESCKGQCDYDDNCGQYRETVVNFPPPEPCCYEHPTE